jgi:hypothetical protein
MAIITVDTKLVEVQVVELIEDIDRVTMVMSKEEARIVQSALGRYNRGCRMYNRLVDCLGSVEIKV